MKNSIVNSTLVSVQTPVLVQGAVLLTMVGGLALAAAIVVGLPLRIVSPQTAHPLAEVPARTLMLDVSNRFASNQVLVKFKPGAETNKVIQEVIQQPQNVIRDVISGRIIQQHMAEYQAVQKSSPLSSRYRAEVLPLSPHQVKSIFPKVGGSQSAATKSEAVVTAEAGITGWEVISVSESDVDIAQLVQAFRARSESVEDAQPDFLMRAAFVPNDPYFASSGTWGQAYDDLWGVKLVNAPKAWDGIYEIRGDLNHDGNINIEDVNLLSSYVQSGIPKPDPLEIADVNGDGSVSADDVAYLHAYVSVPESPAPVDYSKNEVVVAVVDTGVDYSHEDMHPVWQNTDEVPGNSIDDDANGYMDDAIGWDAVSSDSDPLDDDGHGTHVAGIIAAEMGNATGAAGVCPHCTVMALKGLGQGGEGLISGLSELVVYAADNGAKVINMSYGGCGMPSDVERAAIDYAFAKNVTLVAAAGNENDNNATCTPAMYTNVIAVASIDHSSAKSSFSSWGKVDIAAPGGDSFLTNGIPEAAPYVSRNILSLRSAGTDFYGDGYGIVGDKYYRSMGTSMASPFVAGVAGLVLARHPNYSNLQVRNALQLSAVDLQHQAFPSCSTYVAPLTCENPEHASCWWQYADWHCIEYSYTDETGCRATVGCTWDTPTRRCMTNDGLCSSWDISYSSGKDNVTGYGRLDAAAALSAECSDGTVYGMCNASKQYCNQGQLSTVNNCKQCGFVCAASQICNAQGQCVAKLQPCLPGKTCPTASQSQVR